MVQELHWRVVVRTLLAVVGWCLLFLVCWPLAVFALIAWLLSLRMLSITLHAVFVLLRALLLLPARLLGYRARPAGRFG